MVQVYGNGTTALGANQINQHAYERKALIEAVQESYGISQNLYPDYQLF